MAVPFYMAGMEICMNKKKKKFVSYAKWGYICYEGLLRWQCN